MKTDQLYNLFKESEGVSTDTRTIRKGEMFFALWGGKHNGNLYATEALEKGASVAVIDDPLFETDKTILVDDCLFDRGLVVVPVLQPRHPLLSRHVLKSISLTSARPLS